MVSFEDTSIAFESKSPKDLKRTYLLFWLMNNNLLVKAGTSLVKFGLAARLPIKKLVKNSLFKQFCGGETIEESEIVINELAKFKIGTVLDYSVEGEDSEENFERTKVEILKTIEKAAGNKFIPFCVFKISGLGSTALLIKAQKREVLNEKDTADYNKILSRVEALCRASYQKDVRILIDAEETWIQDSIDDITYKMMVLFNKEKAIVFNTFQMYRRDMLENLKKAHEQAVSERYYLGVKLVRGAYMEKERSEAEKADLPSPIQRTKTDTDHDFNEGLKFCVDHIDRIELCCGSHNEQSNYLLVDLMKSHNLKNEDRRIHFVQLYGMSDHISYNLSHAGYNVGKYVPYGPVESVMPYLFRRANENTSIAGQTSREFNLVSKEVKRRTKV